MMGMGIGAASTAALSITFAVFARIQWGQNIKWLLVKDEYALANEFKNNYQAYHDKVFRILGEESYDVTRQHAGYEGILAAAKENGKGSSAAETIKKLNERATSGRNYKIYNGLKWGFTVFTVLLSAADIAITAYSLYKYYNMDHTPIPHHMVDLSYGENKESAYVAYMSVRDQDNNCGDLNGGDCKQWLALYYTKDEKAGTPILAPNEGSGLVVKTGNDSLPDSSYSPLHMFGTPNVAQNLTFADGDNGWSYNDKNKGTYLFFTHADAQVSYSDPTAKTASSESDADTTQGNGAADAKDVGTALSTGVIILIGAAGLVAGIFIGAITTNVRRKKRRVE
jgi:hypothetical protein